MTAGRILIVDDARDNLKMLATLLALDGYLVRAATSGAEALAAVEAERPDLILLDIRMPDIGGLEVCRRLKADPRHEAIPVIFLSAVNEAADKVAAFRCGGADYVTKPVQQEELRARIAHQLEIRRLRQELESKALRIEERAASLRKLSRAVEQNPNMIFITDLDGRIEYVNRKFVELTGFTADEAIGRNPRLIGSSETPPSVYESMWRTILDGRDWVGELKDRRKDGRIFWASASINPVRDEAGKVTHFVAMHEDITARKLAEEEIRNAKDQAEIANRAKTELLANMSHELRTPLNAIIGYSEAMLEGIFGGFANQRQQEYVGDIRGSGMHLLSLINDILDVSAIEAGKVELGEEEVDLADVVDATLRLVGSRATKGNVTLTARLPPGLPRLWGDARRLKQILLNLLSNAVKFTPEGGAVTLSATTAPEGGIVIRVSDTGIGMEPRELEKALSRFGQVDSGLNRRHEGTGLGLPLTKGLIELHGGTMTIDSAKWAGTTVIVTFPPERSRLEKAGEIVR
ncbi:MAG: response regulator [Alphaproteobacteria bacterium]|nr:response regulator [Alphaproteobacteria bacterium]MBF0394654.1 response regulator [Alphaproteobacteria bacterium]